MTIGVIDIDGNKTNNMASKLKQVKNTSLHKFEVILTNDIIAIDIIEKNNLANKLKIQITASYYSNLRSYTCHIHASANKLKFAPQVV